MLKSFVVWGLCALATLSVAPVALADAVLLLDGFASPAEPRSVVVIGPPVTSQDNALLRDFVPSIPGGVRETWLHVYGNPLGSASVAAAGGGRLSVAQGTGATAETLVSYGAFTRPNGPNVGGPLLGLDLSNFDGLQLDFLGSETGLNINVTYYTSAPLDPAAPLYYAGSGINVAPSAPGAALSVKLEFASRAEFNWKQVDGIVVLINRSGPTPSTSYTLQRLAFVRLSE